MRWPNWLLVLAIMVAACSSDSPSESQPATSGTTAEQPAAFPRQPEGVRFPTESWPEGDWGSGVDQAAVDEAVRAAFADSGPSRVRAVVIVSGGKLVFERYSRTGVTARTG